jgi:transcriptional regulator with XRE-family HTH domain
MKSHEVIKAAIDKLGAKKVASDLGVSMSLLYKWSEPTDESGAANPLDRIAELYKVTADERPIEWLCQQADGVFVKNPPRDARIERVDVLKETQRILKEFSDVLTAVSNGWEDAKLERHEAEKIRQEWDELKSIAETFVRGCEQQSVPTSAVTTSAKKRS